GLSVSDVTIPTGATSAPVPVTGVTASPTPITITASLDGVMQTADVRVIGAAEAPRLVDLSPASATISVSATESFRVSLDIPAPTGGVTVLLSLDMGGSVPASVDIPADAISASFMLTAGATATSGTLSATLNTDMFSSAITISDAPTGHLVINEVDYDQPGADMGEFLELYNGDSSPVDLTTLSVVFVNGSSSVDYRTVDLTGSLGAGEYLVLANTGVSVPASVTRIDIPSNGIQNGAPDGVMILDTSTNTIVDALSYEGSITAATVSGMTFNLVEGTPTTAEDNNTDVLSLVRMPNGTDTDDANSDWTTSSTPTPGAANTP
ncbi:MAG: lamin tail domain-containing protein, partial [Deltaproteobacteria bacterium]|nr:lamin tail domain-containing protein [Deltaproteobacteria bacterium]